MYIKHKIYGKIFNIFTIFKIDEKSVSFIVDSKKSFNTNLEYVEKEFKKRDGYKINYFYKDKLSLSSFKKLATSKYVFLNDNFFPLAFMNFKDESKIIQLWHAPGAFKKFGASVSREDNEMIRKISEKITFLIISSTNIKKEYIKAFQIDKDKIKAMGLPRADYYFEKHDIDKLKEKFYKKYPQAKGKKIVLYAPTFRNTEKYSNVFDYLDINEFKKNLGDEYILAIRFHPKITNNFKSQDYINCSNWNSEQELLLLSDILITDYSSIMIEAALLDKPILFFVYDLDNYIKNERDFYFDFKKNPPGVVAYNTEELINALKSNIDKTKNRDIVKKHINMNSKKVSADIVDFIIDGD